MIRSHLDHVRSGPLAGLGMMVSKIFTDSFANRDVALN